MGGTVAVPRPDRLGSLFVLAAVAVAALTLRGVPGSPALRDIAMAWMVLVVAGAFTPWRGTRLGFAALWGALGIAVGFGALSLLSIGAPLLLAAALLGAGIAAMPDRAGWPSPWHAVLANSLAYGVGLVGMIGLAVG